MTKKQTLGEYRVGTSFNPSELSHVDKIKQQAAKLIDLVDEISPLGDYEMTRLKSLALNDIESGAMWAVKAVTKPEWE